MADTSLRDKAEAFAQELSETFAGVLGPDVPRFVAEPSPLGGRRKRVVVRTEAGAEIPLSIGGRLALSMVCDYRCTWDSQSTYLKVHTANVHVLPINEPTPLFRYEFEADKSPRYPCAHLQVHAHRDEFIYTMVRGERRKPKDRADAAIGEPKAGAVPRLSDLHFPLGGPRMRPCVEDVLHMLVSEFDVDVVSGAQSVIEAGRARWRRRQAAAIVHDSPAVAAEVLRSLDYKVRDPESGPAGERTDRLTRF